jgi:hypothetical protein
MPDGCNPLCSLPVVRVAIVGDGEHVVQEHDILLRPLLGSPRPAKDSSLLAFRALVFSPCVRASFQRTHLANRQAHFDIHRAIRQHSLLDYLLLDQKQPRRSDSTCIDKKHVPRSCRQGRESMNFKQPREKPHMWTEGEV